MDVEGEDCSRRLIRRSSRHPARPRRTAHHHRHRIVRHDCRTGHHLDCRTADLPQEIAAEVGILRPLPLDRLDKGVVVGEKIVQPVLLVGLAGLVVLPWNNPHALFAVAVQVLPDLATSSRRHLAEISIRHRYFGREVSVL